MRIVFRWFFYEVETERKINERKGDSKYFEEESSFIMENIPYHEAQKGAEHQYDLGEMYGFKRAG